jgi:preprotein translocase subunit SecF
MTYSEAANLAVNQTIIRSLNTSIVALLPVGAILFVGAGLLGAGTLKDLALALFIGTAAGTYSSIFVATPFLCQLKEKEPAIQALAARVSARRSGQERKVSGKSSSSGSAAGIDSGGGSSGGGSSALAAGATATAVAVAEEESRERSERPHRQPGATGPRNQPKKQPRSKRGK